MKDAIDIQYRCAKCGGAHLWVTVPVRYRERGEDLLAWMEVLKATLSADHNKRSPHCRIKEFTEVKIPAPAGSGIGERVMQ